jgi:formate/nitrite transporter FocA (FNT family)
LYEFDRASEIVIVRQKRRTPFTPDLLPLPRRAGASLPASRHIVFLRYFPVRRSPSSRGRARPFVMSGAKTTVPQSRLLYEDSCEAWCDMGTNHAASHWSAFIVRSILSGFYLNLSFTLGVRAQVQSGGQEILFGIFFSFGLIFITLTDSYLFTQDIATITLSILLKRTPLLRGVRALLLIFVFDYAGSVIGAFFFGYACEFFEDPADPIRQKILAMGIEKTGLGIGSLVSRAMFCNWVVCLANFLQAKTDVMSGKALCVALPISTFASLGLEHSIVNMSILTMCLFLEPHAFTLESYFMNIFVSAIGNMMGAILLMTLPAYYCLWLRWKRTVAQADSLASRNTLHNTL